MCLDALNDLHRDLMVDQLPTIVPKIVERLGDNRDDIRATASKALLSSLDVLGAQQFFQLLLPSFSSRKPKVKEGVSVI